MANIMINELCNLQCPYCFANRYVNGDCSTDMPYGEFKKAVDWINEKHLRGGEPWPDDREVPRIGIIGGEPTLHENLIDLLDYALMERLPGQEILMFTNALEIEKYTDYLAVNDINLLVNLNSPEDIGEEAYAKTVENISHLREKGVGVSLGINYYKRGLDTAFVLDVIKRFCFRDLRVGLTSPNTKEKADAGSFAYFSDISEGVIKLIEDAAELGCTVHFDCQKIPACFMREYEDRVRRCMEKVPLEIFDCAYCSPVIDILPGLRLARCFGVSSDETTVPMGTFEKEEDVISYFAANIDSIAMLTVKESKCRSCYERMIGKCQSGCMSFKMEEVLGIIGKGNVNDKLGNIS